MRRWEALVDRYLTTFRMRGVSEDHIKNTGSELDRWGAWLKRRRPRPRLEDVSSEMLIRYIRTRTVCRAKATVYGVVSKLRGMGDLLVREGIWRQNHLRWIRGPKLDPRARVPRRIKKVHLEKLLVTAARSHLKYYRYMWVAVLMLLYSTGLRRGELERLDVSDWDREENMIKIDGRKTGRERRVPVSDSVCGAIEAYLVRRHNRLEKFCNLEEEALFINKYGGRMKGASIGVSLHKLARRADIPLVTIHQFRHTCASDLLEGGINLTDVQKILGHADISSTMRYLHVADPQRRKAMERHPINEMLGMEGSKDG